jgi:pilus assembly protein CpaC
MKLKFLLFAICFMTLGLSPACAGEDGVNLKVNELKVFPVYKLERVAIGDPAVADVSILSEKELMLQAKKAGVTDLIIWDGSGQSIFNVTVIEKSLEKVAERIGVLFSSSDIRGIKVKVEEENIYIIGDVLSGREVEKIKDILMPFTNVINLVRVKERQPLVEIDVEVLEIGYDDQKSLGLNWSDSLTYTEPAGTRTAGSEYDAKTHITGKAPKVWRVFKWDRSTVTAQLNFLLEEDRARTLSNPKLVTLSGKEASFVVGGEVPYVTVETEGRTKAEWKNYGIELKIHPVVNAKNEIRTKIEAEVSDLDWDNAVTESNHEIPALATRKMQTELFLNDGDTIFMAGLIKNEDSRNVDRVPWLSQLPVLGELFKSKAFRDKRTELVISITPTIISEDSASSADGMAEGDVCQQRFSAYSEESSPLAYYSHMIEDIIVRNVAYPAEAEEAKLEGIVKIELCLLSGGQLQEVLIKESSGYDTLDDAVISAVQEQVPYPSFPSQVTQKQLRLTIPVVFKSYAQAE